MNDQTKASMTAAQGPYFGPKGYGNDAFEIQDSKRRVVVLKFCDVEFANRVLATLNACEGISTEDLESMGRLGNGPSVATNYAHMERDRDALRAEVERLRETFRELASWANLRADDPRWNNLGGRVSAALASAAKAA